MLVSVGYIDTRRPDPYVPVPWKGAPGVVFVGDYDRSNAGAIRIDNPTTQAVAVTACRRSSPITMARITRDPWQPPQGPTTYFPVAIPPGQSAIFTATAPGLGDDNFDTSSLASPASVARCPAMWRRRTRTRRR